MHLDILLSDLKSLYGNPRHGQTEYRWEILPPNAMSPVHLCVNIEQISRTASIWIFDPRQGDQSALYLHVENQAELRQALATIRQRLAHS